MSVWIDLGSFGSNQFGVINLFFSKNSYASGLCYGVIPQFGLEEGQTHMITLSMRENINPVDRPEKVEVTITSNKNRYGIIKNIWTEGEKTDRIEYIFHESNYNFWISM